MKSLAFVVPVHGRLELASICLRQLRRTCDLLRSDGVNANAVIVADRATLAETIVPLGLGFATVERDNEYLGRRFNDGIQLATDPRYSDPVDYVVPFGSDDWADHRLFLEPLPDADTIQGFQHMSFVSEDGTEISSTFLNYEGGSGIRIIPRELVEPLGYRPADEDRPRGCDTSILSNIRKHHGDSFKVKHMHLHDRQIVDWKTEGSQLNPYRNVAAIHKSRADGDPFDALKDFYPPEALDEMRFLYAARMVAA